MASFAAQLLSLPLKVERVVSQKSDRGDLKFFRDSTRVQSVSCMSSQKHPR